MAERWPRGLLSAPELWEPTRGFGSGVLCPGVLPQGGGMSPGGDPQGSDGAGPALWLPFAARLWPGPMYFVRESISVAQRNVCRASGRRSTPGCGLRAGALL